MFSYIWPTSPAILSFSYLFFQVGFYVYYESWHQPQTSILLLLASWISGVIGMHNYAGLRDSDRIKLARKLSKRLCRDYITYAFECLLYLKISVLSVSELWWPESWIFNLHQCSQSVWYAGKAIDWESIHQYAILVIFIIAYIFIIGGV
jgi:hypothetical protein